MSNALLIILIVIGVIIVFPVFWVSAAKIVRKIWHFPSPPYVGHFLDSDLRRRMQPAGKLIARSGIKPGMKVLDLGCGSGAYTADAARMVGTDGKVYALDVQPAMLEQLRKKLAKPENADISNIELIQASAYELPFEDASLDVVYLVTVLEEIPDIPRALAEVKRVLKPGGVVAVTEFFPDPDYSTRRTTAKKLAASDFARDAVEGGFFNYTARFVKA